MNKNFQQRIVHYWAEWPSSRDRFSRYTNSDWKKFREDVDECRQRPSRTGAIYECSCCKVRYDVPNCTFEDAQHVHHAHGRKTILVQKSYGAKEINVSEHHEMMGNFRKGMVEAVNTHSVAELFRDDIG